MNEYKMHDKPACKSACSRDRADSLKKGSLLCDHWKKACGVAWAVFVPYEIAIGLDRLYSKHPLCPYNASSFNDWFRPITCGVVGGFVLLWLLMIDKLRQIRCEYKRVPLLVAFNIVTIATITSILSVVFAWGGVCIDVLDVASPAAMWGEWWSSGPLLFFLALTVVDKPRLSRTDWLLIFSFFMTIVMGFLVIIPQPFGSAVFSVSASFIAYMPTLFHSFMAHSASRVIPDEDKTSVRKLPDRISQRANMLFLVSVCFHVFPIIYIIAAFRGMSHSDTIVTYQIFNVLIKGALAAYAMDIHLDLINEAERDLQEELRANHARREFMKYIFHEVRTPLSSLPWALIC